MTTNQETSLRERLLAEAAEFERAAGNNTDPDEGGHDKATARLLREAAEALAARAEPQAGEWVLVPRKLTAENGAKAALIGEFAFRDGSGSEHNVPWHVIKEIHSRVVETFAAAPSPASRARPEAQSSDPPPGWEPESSPAEIEEGRALSATLAALNTPPADRAPGEVDGDVVWALDFLDGLNALGLSRAAGTGLRNVAVLIRRLAARAPSAQGDIQPAIDAGYIAASDFGIPNADAVEAIVRAALTHQEPAR